MNPTDTYSSTLRAGDTVIITAKHRNGERAVIVDLMLTSSAKVRFEDGTVDWFGLTGLELATDPEPLPLTDAVDVIVDAAKKRSAEIYKEVAKLRNEIAQKAYRESELIKERNELESIIRTVKKLGENS
jgi:hypothetical protein